MKDSRIKRNILITGGTGGLGSALVKLLSGTGNYRIAITGRKNSTRLTEVAEKYNIKHAYEWDASNKAEIEEILRKITDDWGTIDVLVNSIGIVNSRPFLEMREDEVLDEYQINVLGPLYAIQAVVPYMLHNSANAKILNISSLRGLPQLASKRSISYSMTKAALISLTSALAKEYGPKIQINAIAPGFTITPMSESWSRSTWKSAIDKTSFHRPAAADEIAEHIAFLISEKCSYIMGQTILVDGGYSIFDK